MPIPALRTAPIPADKIGRALVWAGGLLHAIGTEILKARNEELAAQLDEARAELAELRRAELGDVDEHQGADVDEHLGPELDERQRVVGDWYDSWEAAAADVDARKNSSISHQVSEEYSSDDAGRP